MSITRQQLENDGYKRCSECNAYFKGTHKCSGLMKLLVIMAKKNGKELYFTNVSLANDPRNKINKRIEI